MLLSRVADALYWIGRYLERAEHVSRIIDVRLDLGIDRQSTSGVWDFRRLYASLSLAQPDVYPGNPTALIECAMFDIANRESVIACVTAARDNARQVREEISSDMWEHLNALFLDLKEAGWRSNAPTRRTWHASVFGILSFRMNSAPLTVGAVLPPGVLALGFRS